MATSVVPADAAGEHAVSTDWVAPAILTLALLLGAWLRVHLLLTDDGIYWPDEIYQSLEPAHWLVFGYGRLPWEYTEGARSWAFPGFVALWMEVAAAFGGDHPRAYLTLIRIVFSALSLVGAAGAYALARQQGASQPAAAAGAACGALLAPFIYFAPRAMSEAGAAVPVVFGFLLALAPGAGRARTMIGAALIGLAVLFRLQAGLFAVGLVGVLLGRRRFARAADALAVLAVCALALGWLDHVMYADTRFVEYDGWFRSAIVYVEVNFIEGGASEWGVSPWHYYFSTLYKAAPLATLLAGALSLVAIARAPGLWLVTALFVGAHALIPHKELRFILPAVPLWCALVGIGISVMPWRAVRQGALALVVGLAVISALHYRELTFGQVGQYPDRPQVSAYDDAGEINRLLLIAHDRPELCGIRIDATLLEWTGGYAYLHRDVPYVPRDDAPLESGRVNYVIARADQAPPGLVVATDRDAVLVKVRDEPCVR